MCSISGFISLANKEKNRYERSHIQRANTLAGIIQRATDRGKDSFGAIGFREQGQAVKEVKGTSLGTFLSGLSVLKGCSIVINNNRAEPTTERVAEKSLGDIQPFRIGMSAVAHNGTIANDKDKKVFPARLPTLIDSGVLPHHFEGVETLEAFVEKCNQIIGSFAIAYSDGDALYLATNYKPLYQLYDSETETLFFSSQPQYLRAGPASPFECSPIGLQPYSAARIGLDGCYETRSLLGNKVHEKALVICSGGLDSTVVAAYAKSKHAEVELLHYHYNCRAQRPETTAVLNVAQALKLPLNFIDIDLKKIIGGSPLFEVEELAGGEAGAEFAHEWVPARNLIMLALAVGYAEAKGFDVLYLGNNLEEAGAYPDNEMEFINKLNQVLPYAVQNGKQVRIEMPVGNLVKHEIVAMGLQLAAPMELTWSCYHAGATHCGECGPCYMRKKAHEINGQADKVFG